MIELIFPDGSKREFEAGVTGRQVAASIAPSLAKRAVLIKLDGELLDVDRPLDEAFFRERFAAAIRLSLPSGRRRFEARVEDCEDTRLLGQQRIHT